MSISDDGIPLGRTTLLNGAAPPEGDATLDGGVIQQPVDALLPDGSSEDLAIGSRFFIPPPDETILLPGPVFTLNPVIDDIQPRSGAPGTAVAILGRNFTPFEGVVRFNGVVSAYNANTTTRIDTVVPNGATTGPVSVDGFNSPFDFVVLAPSTAPTLAGFSPTGGRPGDVVSISGTNLDRVTEARFNGVRADGLFLFSPSILQATVPAGATTGPISVSGPTGSATSAGSFVVAAGAPAITGFSPTAGAPGAQVEIFGTELGGANRVTFNGQDAQFSAGNTLVRATVPGFVGTGPIRVHTPLGIAVSPGNFTAGAAPPSISSISPTSGRPGDVVAINGTSLDQVTGVRIGNVRIQVISRPSNQQIVFTLPSNAVTGPIIAEFPGGEVQGGVFTVLPPATTTVTGIQPSQGFPGIGVFISGTGLDRVTGGSFPPGIPVNLGQTGDGRLATTVPAGALTGPITLNTPTGAVLTPVFTVIADTAPSVTVLAPSAGQTFSTGQVIDVSWSAGDDGTLVSQDVLLSVNGGASFQALRSGLPGATRTVQVQLPAALPSENAVIAVRATDNTGKSGEGRSGSFRIVGAPADSRPMVRVDSPNGGETFTVGQTISIGWTSSDDVGLVSHDVRISYDGGITFEPVATGIPGFRRQAMFTFPRASNGAVVSVIARDTLGQQTEDRSDAPFRILPPAPADQPPTVAVTAPNGGEALTVGQAFTVSWNSSDDMGLAAHDVAVSYDGGASWESLVVGIPGFRRNLQFTPTGPSAAALISVTAVDTAGQRTTDRSDAPFRILPADQPPVVTVTSPNGGEAFQVGQNVTVTWTAADDAGIASQEVRVSYDGGASWEPVLQNLPGTERRGVFTARTLSDQALVAVRVTDTAQQTTVDRSDAFFRIVSAPPAVRVIAPNGGETFQVGQPFTISWESTGELASHDVLISFDGGASFQNVARGIPGFRRNAMFTPARPSDNAVVQVIATDTAGRIGEDRSDAPFRIVPAAPADAPPMVTVTAPNGGETLTVGVPFTISWISSDDMGLVAHDVAISYDGGASWENLVAGIPGTRRNLLFTPARASDAALVSVTAADSAGQRATDTSDAPFRIVPAAPTDQKPMVTVLSPNGGESFAAGQTVTISWNSSDDREIVSHDVRFSVDGGATFQPIATGIPGFRRQAQWTVPNQGTDRGLVAVSATDSAGQRTEDLSDGFFRIIPDAGDMRPRVTVLAPNGGEFLIPGQTVTVSWTSSDDRGLAQHDVRFSTDGGITFKPIAEKIPGFRRQAQWTVPLEPTSLGLVSVTATDTVGQTIEDRSDGFFTIVGLIDLPPRVRVTTPNGGETLLAGQTVTVSWEAGDNEGIVSQDVKFSTDGGATWQPIALGIPGFRRNAQWTVPDVVTDRALVSVAARDTRAQTGEDRSDGFFSIVRLGALSVTVLAPNGGEQLQPGQVVTVNWQTGGSVAPASQEVRFSADGGANFTPIVTGLPGSARSIAWTVPSVQTQTGLIQVIARDAAGNAARDRSDGFFTIGAPPQPIRVNVLAPNGGERFVPGQVTTISWAVSGDTAAGVQDVRFSADGGATFEPIELGIPGFRRNLQWTVPDRPTERGLVSVTVIGAQGQVTEDRGDGFFTIAAVPLAPVVESIFPSQGPVSGGTPVTIRGRNFDARARVRIGGMDAVTTAVSSTMVNALTPRALFAGFVNVAVLNPDGQRGVLADGFRYVSGGTGDPVSGQVVFQSATVADPVPDPDAGVPDEDAFEDAADAAVADAAPLAVDGAAEGDAALADGDAGSILAIAGQSASAAEAADASAPGILAEPVEGTAISRPLGRSLLLPADAEPILGELPGTEVVAAAAGAPEIIELRAGETVTFSLFAELFDAQGQPVRDRLLDIVSGGNPEKSTVTVIGNPVLSFNPFFATLATAIDTPAGNYLLAFAGQTLTAPFLRTPDLVVPIRVLPARRRVRVFVSPARQAAAPGGTATFQVRLRRRNLPEIPVRLRVSGTLPAGVAATFDPPRPLGDEATLRVQLPAEMTAGEFPLVVTARVNVPGARAIPADPVTVEVKPAVPTAFRLESGAATVTDPEPEEGPIEPAATAEIVAVPAGGTVVFPITALLFDGFGNRVADDVDFDLRGVPPGAVFTIVPNPGRTFRPSVVSVVTTRLTPVGRYVLEISGDSLGFPGITYGPIRIPLEVKPRIRRVEITAQTVEARVTAGQTAEYPLTLSRTGFRDRPVQLLVDPASLPAGATAAFDPAAPTGNAAVLRIATGAATPAGTYTVSIGGKTEVDGVEIRGTTVQLVVDAAPATRTVKLAVTPTSAALRPGGTARFAVKLNRTNATDVQVTLRAAGSLPAGTVFAFTPTRTITSSSTLVVTLPADARPGAYAFQVVGTTATAGVTIEPSASVAVKIDPATA